MNPLLCLPKLKFGNFHLLLELIYIIDNGFVGISYVEVVVQLAAELIEVVEGGVAHWGAYR